MGKLFLDDVQPGMQLADDILAPNGRLLLSRDTELKEKHVEICKAWGVTEVDIKGIDSDQEEQGGYHNIGQQAWEESCARIEPLFVHTDQSDPVMRELYHMAVLRDAAGLNDTFSCCSPDHPNPGTASGETARTGVRAPKNPRDLVKHETQLVSLPDVFYRIMEVLNSPRSSMDQIADVVSKDISLSAKLLRLVNSSFYGFHSQIDTIPRAITLIGTNELMILAQGLSLLHVFQSIPDHLISMKGFWKHSIACGIISRLLASNLIEYSEEKFFVAGLLHNIGRLVMAKKHPKCFYNALLESRSEEKQLRLCESKAFEYDHTVVGGLLCKEWNLPLTLENSIYAHHNPYKQKYSIDAVIVHVANSITHALLYGCSGNIFVPGIQSEAWKTLNLPTGSLRSLEKQADRQVREILNVFLDHEHE
jgi:HD-like signal output (HDOD) protein